MKIKFLATGQSVDTYSFSGEVITAHYNDEQDSFDLSEMNEGDKFQGCETTLDISGNSIIRDAVRIDGELHVTLCQKTGLKGNWAESDWTDSTEYDPEILYIQEVE